MKILIAAGGTGGHVFPALAVAAVLRQRGHEVVWMGTPDSFEARTVPAHGIPMEWVHVRGLRGKGGAALLLAPLQLLRALLEAIAALRRQRPDAVLGMGGFAAGPGGLAAWLLGIPLVIHEQNAAAGLTNRLLARLATRVLQAFPDTLPRGRTVGNPVRPGFFALPPPAQRIAERPHRVLVIGGSQGARALNERVPEALALMDPAERPQVRHQAGRSLELAQACYARAGVEARVEGFIDQMSVAFGEADLLICRAGASTVAELTSAGCPALLVPFPHAVDDHQTRNGAHLVAAGAAEMIAEAGLSPQRLAEALRRLLADRAHLVAMGEIGRRIAWTDCAERMAQ
ncbi:MAG TPA: undecaprenyldiphospho-muramoylpentapeptide beta-N-acetylglucosaminyltransferase, partial [Nevskiaceae bacterium]|nr:undecaprenyldiphospho-muramoylpentapeptide beta-N-acetylglucosaminyltransferase [Nevskiaceae bacterium]